MTNFSLFFLCLENIDNSIELHKDEIEKLDQNIGDGDHIFNIQRGLKESLNLKEELKDVLNLELVAVGSEGDKSKNICEESGFNYFEYENQPMSEKWNFGLQMTKKFNPDAVIIIGSDDLIDKPLLKFYDKKFYISFSSTKISQNT